MKFKSYSHYISNELNRREVSCSELFFNDYSSLEWGEVVRGRGLEVLDWTHLYPTTTTHTPDRPNPFPQSVPGF